MSHHRLIAAAAIITTLSSWTAASPAQAQQNLTGSTLEPLRDAESLFDGLIQPFGGGKNRPVKAAIERVAVSEDTPRRLVVTVTYSGLGQSTTLLGEVRAADRRTLDHIEAQPVNLTEPNGQATLAFEMRGSREQEMRGQSTSLRIVAMEQGQGRRIPLVSRLFMLSKNWNAKPGPGNIVLNVVAKPIGTAARLGPQPDYAAPPKIAVPMGVMLAKPATMTATPATMPRSRMTR